MQRSALPLLLQEGSAALISHTVVGAEELNCLALNPSGSLLAAADDSGTVRLLELPSWQARQALQGGHTSICSSVAFSPQQPSQGVPVRQQVVSCSTLPSKVHTGRHKGVALPAELLLRACHPATCPHGL